MAKKGGGGKTTKIGRNAGSGRFTSISKAKAKPSTHVIETIKVTGKSFRARDSGSGYKSMPPDPRPIKKK